MEIAPFKDLTKYREYMTSEFCLCCAYWQETKGHFGYCREKQDKKPYDGSKKGTGKVVCWRLRSCFVSNNVEFELPAIAGLVRQKVVQRPKKIMRQWLKKPKKKYQKRRTRKKVFVQKPIKPSVIVAKRCFTCGAVFIDRPNRLDHEHCHIHSKGHKPREPHITLSRQSVSEMLVHSKLRDQAEFLPFPHRKSCGNRPIQRKHNSYHAKRCVDCGAVFTDNHCRIDHDRCNSHAASYRMRIFHSGFPNFNHA